MHRGDGGAAYDANGNMVLRVECRGEPSCSPITYQQEFDAENRLVVVTNTVTGQVVRFVYDGDGNRILRIGSEGTTVYIGDYYEREGSTVRKYYYAGGQRIAVRVDGALYFLHSDHLGSATLTTDANGDQVGEVRYKPYGEVRQGYPVGVMPTDRLYTGQRWDSGLGLYDYRARHYHPLLGRFVQADTIVQTDAKHPTPYLPLAVSYADPKILERWNQLQRSRLQSEAQPPNTPFAFDPQFLNRYTYARDNPLAYVDDSGHIAWWIVGGVVGGVVGFGAYAITHRDNFDWKQAVLWTAGGVVVGATFGAGAQWVAGTIGAQAAVTAGTTAVTAACADANCINEVEATERIITTGWTVIGKYPAYLEKARQLGANALNVSMEEWSALGSRAAQWARNVQFLDEAIARGDSFRLATPFAQGWAEKGTFFKQELVYLLQRGYELVTDINGAEWLIKTH